MTNTIKVKSDIFVIPNGSYTYGKANSFVREDVEKVARDNNFELKDSEPLIQVWATSNSLNCENLECHQSFFKIGNEEYTCGRIISGILPYSLINIKEGETKTLLFKDIKAVNISESTGETTSVDFEITFKASQLDYRYRRFGTFEETLQYVL